MLNFLIIHKLVTIKCPTVFKQLFYSACITLVPANKKQNPRTRKVRGLKLQDYWFFNDNLFAVVITTFGTNAMRHFHLMTLRTFD